MIRSTNSFTFALCALLANSLFQNFANAEPKDCIQGEPIMVIGLDLQREFRLQIDRDDKVVFLGREAAPGSARRFQISPHQGRVRRD